MDTPDRHLELSSGMCTFRDTGESTHSLLMLHGFSFRKGLDPLVRALQPGFRVVAPDLPFSTRDDYKANHTLESYVDFLLELIERLRLKKVSIFGNSVGGTLGLMCCLKAPDKVDKLVVRCPLWSSAQLPYYLRLMPLIALHDRLSEVRSYAFWALDTFYRLSARLSPVENHLDNRHGAQGTGWKKPYTRDQINPDVLSRFLSHLIRVEIQAALPLIENQTLILWGKDDQFIKSRWGCWLSEVLPNSTCIRMAGEYHNIATVNYERSGILIKNFLLGKKIQP